MYNGNIVDNYYTLRKYKAIIEAQGRGELVVGPDLSYREYVPCVIDFPKSIRLNNFSYKTPDGVLSLSYYSDYYIYKANEGTKIPDVFSTYKPIEVTTCKVDLEKRVATIELKDDTLTIYDVNVSQRIHEFERELKDNLTHSGYKNLIIEKIYAVNSPNIDDPYSCEPVFIANEHTRMPVSGYATYGDFLIYASFVGHKSLIDSMVATIKMGKNPNLFTADGSKRLFSPPGSKYTVLSKQIQEQNVVHVAVISNTALPGKWEYDDNFACALSFRSDANPQEALDRRLLNKLNEAIAVPIIDKWIPVIKKRSTYRILESLNCYGDVLSGFCIKFPEEDPWTGFIGDLLAMKQIGI